MTDTTNYVTGRQPIEWCRAQSVTNDGYYGPGTNDLASVPDGSTGICYELTLDRRIAFHRLDDSSTTALPFAVESFCNPSNGVTINYCLCQPPSPSPPPPSPPPPLPPMPPAAPPAPPLQQCTHAQHLLENGDYSGYKVTREWCYTVGTTWGHYDNSISGEWWPASAGGGANTCTAHRCY